MRRPQLNRIPLEAALGILCNAVKGQCIITMSAGQWDMLLEAAYQQGWTLLELDRKERPIAAYKRQSGQGVARID